jgi:2-phosphosulfolactate phosphatase
VVVLDFSPYNQVEFEIRCEWGLQGAATLAPISDVVIIVDVLSFSTCVEVATTRGAWIYPYGRKDESAATYADSIGALVAHRHRSPGTFSLSPASLQTIPAGTKLVLPSPNGSTLSLGTGNTPTLAGCLRNAKAVADAAQQMGRSITVIPAGERWRTDGSLRPSFEDWVGVGAIISHLHGRKSPEAQSAEAVFRAAESTLATLLAECASGKELMVGGFADDVVLASAYNVSTTIPILREGCYRAMR